MMAEADTKDEGPSLSRFDDLTRKLKGWYTEDIRKVVEWREQAREDFGF